MKTTQAIFSAVLISTMTAAGLVKGVDTAWMLAIATAALAFFSEEMRNFSHTMWGFYLGNALVLASWATGAGAGLALIIYS